MGHRKTAVGALVVNGGSVVFWIHTLQYKQFLKCKVTFAEQTLVRRHKKKPKPILNIMVITT